MKPPPPMLPAAGSTTAKAKAVATAASTALPPRFRISVPASEASDSSLATCRERPERVRAAIPWEYPGDRETQRQPERRRAMATPSLRREKREPGKFLV